MSLICLFPYQFTPLSMHPWPRGLRSGDPQRCRNGEGRQRAAEPGRCLRRGLPKPSRQTSTPRPGLPASRPPAPTSEPHLVSAFRTHPRRSVGGPASSLSMRDASPAGPPRAHPLLAPPTARQTRATLPLQLGAALRSIFPAPGPQPPSPGLLLRSPRPLLGPSRPQP